MNTSYKCVPSMRLTIQLVRMSTDSQKEKSILIFTSSAVCAFSLTVSLLMHVLIFVRVSFGVCSFYFRCNSVEFLCVLWWKIICFCECRFKFRLVNWIFISTFDRITLLWLLTISFTYGTLCLSHSSREWENCFVRITTTNKKKKKVTKWIDRLCD